jgi:dihydroxy-acid dehydratase
MARAADVELTIDDFQTIADKTPYLADLKFISLQASLEISANFIHRPSGKYMMEDLHNVGGIPALLKYLLNHTDLIDGSQLTVTGKTLAQNLEDIPELDIDNQDVVRRLDKPIKETGHITILRGSLAPGTAVAKITGKEGLKFEGVAKCFDECVFYYLPINGVVEESAACPRSTPRWRQVRLPPEWF